MPSTGMRRTTLPTRKRGISDGFLHTCEGLDLRELSVRLVRENGISSDSGPRPDEVRLGSGPLRARGGY